jgi:hypothetical protein
MLDYPRADGSLESASRHPRLPLALQKQGRCCLDPSGRACAPRGGVPGAPRTKRMEPAKNRTQGAARRAKFVSGGTASSTPGGLEHRARWAMTGELAADWTRPVLSPTVNAGQPWVLAAPHRTLRTSPPSRQNRLCCPANPRPGIRTIFCASDTAVPMRCAVRPCARRIASTRSAEAPSTT